MTVTNAQFSAWLATDAPRVVLCEMKFAYESGGAPAEGTAYFSTRPYRTKPTDSPAGQRYRSLIRDLPNIKRSVNPDALGGMTEISVGSLVFDNADGEVDFLLDLIIDGRAVNFYIGDQAWDRADFRLVLSVLAEVAQASGDDTVTITLRDKRLLLDREIAGNVVNDERRLPLVFVFDPSEGCASIEPVEADAATLKYYVLQNFANGALLNVFDNGVSLMTGGGMIIGDNTAITADAGTDTIMRVGHGLAVDDVLYITGTGTIFAGLTLSRSYWVISAGLTADNFRLSETKGGAAVNLTGTTFSGELTIAIRRVYDNVATDGTIVLSSPPAGRLTCDVAGYSASQVTSPEYGPGELLRAMMIDYSDVAVADVDSASFRGIFAEITATIQSTARSVIDRENLLDVLDDIARVDQICIGEDHEGVFRAFRINLSGLSGEVASRDLAVGDVFGAPSVRNDRVITGTVAINSRRNYRPLTYGELAASVAVDQGREFAGQFRETKQNTTPTGTAYSTNWQGFYKTAASKVLQGAFAQTNTDIRDMADEILGDLKPHIKTVEVDTDLRAYEWRLGEVVALTYPRYGFDAGVNCRLIGIETYLTNEIMRLTLLTRIAPDTTSATH